MADMYTNDAEFDDVKLAGDRPSEQIRESHAADDKWETYQQNGNIARAQKIGATLGGIIAGNKQGDAGAGREDTLHMVLAAFACVAAMESGLPDKLLVRVALNVFYDVVKKENPWLYDQMGSSGAFTFFYLAWRKPGDAYRNVAETFAMLAGKTYEAETDQDQYAADTRELFLHSCDFAEAAVREVAFE